MNEIATEKPAVESDAPRMTRRRLLGSAAGIAAAAATALLPPNVRCVLAEPTPQRGSLKDIKHVVMLMQENRSFDHYFGTLAGVRGFDDPEALSAFQREIGFSSTRPRESQRLFAAVSSRHPDHERAENAFDESCLECSARGLESWPNG